MKKLMNRGLVALVGMVLLLASCGKYEGGPGLSLATKKGRVAGTWIPSSYEDANGNVTTYNGDEFTITYDKDGTVTYTLPVFGSQTGTWEFNSDKTAITTNFNGSTDTSDPIYRLTSKDLWFKDADGSIFKYVAQ
jgi:hypothetical protein